MSSISQSKDHHWKLVANRKSRMDTVFDQGTKKKFTPLKDNLVQDSKVFQKSRERSNSPFSGLNKSHDADIVSIREKRSEKMLESAKKIQTQPSVLISTIKKNEFRLLDSAQLAKHQTSALNTIVEVQKQFKQFKEKVMKLIQRQQQQINQLAKDILNTFEFQLTKLKDLKFNKCEDCKFVSETLNEEFKHIQPQKIISMNIKIEAKNQKKPKLKQIQDLKQDLNNLKKNQKTSPSIKSDGKSNSVLQKSESTQEIPKLNFQKIHIRFENVFDIFNKLKFDMSEMEEIRASLQKKKVLQIDQ